MGTMVKIHIYRHAKLMCSSVLLSFLSFLDFSYFLLLTEPIQEPYEASESEEQLMLSAGRTGGIPEGGCLAEGEAEQQISCSARDNTELVR